MLTPIVSCYLPKYLLKKRSSKPSHAYIPIVMIMALMLNVSAGFAADTPSILKLDDALKIASDQNKDIKAAMEYRNWVNGKYVEERSAALPEIGFTAKALIGRDETQKAGSESAPLSQTAYGGQFMLNQALFTWGKIGAAIRAAEIGMKTADDQLSLHRQAVARDVSTSFYDVLLAKELQSIASQNLSQKLRHLDEAERKYSAGTATEYDVLSADVAVRNARPEVIQSENLVRISRDRLGILLGGLEGAAFDVYGSLESGVSPLPDLHDAVAIAVEKRPELSELHHKIGMQKEVVTIMEAQNKPRIDFQASYGWQDLDVGYGQGRADGQVYSGAIVFSYPFFDGFRTDGKAEQSRSDLRTLMLQEEKLRDNIRLQVAEALNKLKESAEILQAIAGTVAQAEKLSDMAEKGFVYGVKTNLDVQDAQLALKEARGNLAKARRDYLVAKVTLEWVMGTLELVK